MLVLAPLVVYIYHRLGFRWCMVISSFFYVLAFLVTPFMPNLNFLFISYSIPFGIAASVVATLSITTQRKYFDKYYGFAVGVRFCSNSLGGIAFSFTLPIIIQAIGVEKTFLSLLVLTPVFLCSALAYLSNVDDTQTDHDISRNTEPLTRRNIYYEFFQDKSFLIYLASSGVVFFSIIIPMIYMVSQKYILHALPLRSIYYLFFNSFILRSLIKSLFANYSQLSHFVFRLKTARISLKKHPLSHSIKLQEFLKFRPLTRVSRYLRSQPRVF